MPEVQAQGQTASWSRVPFAPRMVATFCGSGFARPAPGTWGTLAALIPVALWWQLAPPAWHQVGLLLGVLSISFIGVWAANVCIATTGIHDPGQIVVDEVAGVWTTLLCIPPAVVIASPLTALIVAFVLFRLFDIIKPWPIAALEHLPRGWGVMADDLAAGVCSGVLAAAVLR